MIAKIWQVGLSALAIVFLCVLTSNSGELRAQDPNRSPTKACVAKGATPKSGIGLGTWSDDPVNAGKKLLTFNWTLTWDCTGVIQDPTLCKVCIRVPVFNANGIGLLSQNISSSATRDCGSIGNTWNITSTISNWTPGSTYWLEYEFTEFNPALGMDCETNQVWQSYKGGTYTAPL